MYMCILWSLSQLILDRTFIITVYCRLLTVYHQPATAAVLPQLFYSQQHLSDVHKNIKMFYIVGHKNVTFISTIPLANVDQV